MQLQVALSIHVTPLQTAPLDYVYPKNTFL